MFQATHAARAPQRPLSPGAQVWRHVNRLFDRARAEDRVATEFPVYIRSLRRRDPERLEAFVRHLQRSLNSAPERTGMFTRRQVRALVLGDV